MRQLFRISLYKTLIFNFKYFSIYDALKFPILISKNVKLLKLEGNIFFNSTIKRGMIKIGFGDVSIFDRNKSKCLFSIKGSGKLIFNGKANIGHGAKININNKGILELGNNFEITAESSIICSKNIVFGENCLISWETLMMDTDFHNIYNLKNECINNDSEIIIGNNVWIGCRSTILKGSKIPNNSIIAANSLISRELNGTSNIFYAKKEINTKEFNYWRR